MKAVFIFTLTFLLWAPASQAETLNLEQAIKRALKADPRIREREQLVKVARAVEQEANNADGVIYNVNTFVGLAPRKTGDLLTTDSGGNSISRSDVHEWEGIAPWYVARFSIIKPLNTYGKIEHYSAAAKQNVEVKKNDIKLEQAKIKFDVNRAYYGYLTARDSRLLLEDVKNRLNKAIKLVENWLNEGSGNAKQSDMFALQTGVALIKRYQAEAQGLENIALTGLKVLTGVGQDKPLEVADKKIAPVELPKESLKKLQARALVKRPEMLQLTAGLNARRSLVKAKKSENKPNLYAGVIGSWAKTPARTAQNNPFITDPFNHRVATPIVGFKWDLESGRHPAQVQQAQAEFDALVEKNSFAKQGIPFQVAKQYELVHSHHIMVEELAKGSRAGRRWMISSYADFEAGLETSDRVMGAFQGYVLAHSDYLKAVNDYNLHVVMLKSVTGDL